MGSAYLCVWTWLSDSEVLDDCSDRGHKNVHKIPIREKRKVAPSALLPVEPRTNEHKSKKSADVVEAATSMSQDNSSQGHPRTSNTFVFVLQHTESGAGAVF